MIRRSITVNKLMITKSFKGTAAIDVGKMTIVDSSSITSGINRGFYISYTHSVNAIAGGEIDCLAIDVYATANIGSIYGISIYMSPTGNVFTGNVFAIGIYMEDVGNAASSVCPIDIGRVTTNTGSARDCFIRCKQHGGADAKTVFLIETTGTKMATNLITICGQVPAFLNAITPSGSIVGSLKVLHEATPSGATKTTYYIPLYTS